MSEEGNWRDSLPDEIKGSEALANFEDVGSLAQGFIEAKSYQGASVRIPGEDAGDEARREFTDKLVTKVPTLMYKPNLEDQEQSVEFYRSLGMPETPDKYEVPEIEAPDNVEIKTDKIEGFREIAHKHGLTAAQFKGIMGDIVNADIQEAQQAAEGVQANQEAIKEKFGHAYKENMGKITNMLEKTEAPSVLVEAVKNGQVGVETIQWMYQMGKQMGGEGLDFTDADDSTTRAAAMTPDEAKAAIDEINNNKEHPYWIGVGDEKKRAIDRMIQLQTFANPGATLEMKRAG